MTFISRREFIATTSLAALHSAVQSRGGVAPGGQAAPAHMLPSALASSGDAASAWLPEQLSSVYLRSLAHTALDAALQAGASYADVRVAEAQQLRIVTQTAAPDAVTLSVRLSYGVRVCVDGAWAFVHGREPSVEATAVAARTAVGTARNARQGNGGSNAAQVEFITTPAVTGEWTMPIRLDPFTVPIGDQAALLGACYEAAGRVRGVSGGLAYSLSWIRERRVFASTDGSDVTQTRYQLEPSINVIAGLPMMESLSMPVLWPMSGGYECVTVPDLQDTIKSMAEDAARLVWLPTEALDVGRYPVVFDGTTLGGTFVRTIGCALESDRALGEEVGGSGQSYLSPPRDIIGQMIASPELTVTANRRLPSITTARWDDEGVVPREVPVITNGCVERYFTSRQTAIAASKVCQPGAPATCIEPLVGGANAPHASDPVLVRVPHLTIDPGASRNPINDLCREVRDGVLVRHAQYGMINGTLSSGLLQYHSILLKLQRGRVVSRLLGNALQFNTPKLWKSMTALGDATTCHSSAVHTTKGEPESSMWHSVSAPAGSFKAIDVISTKTRL